MARKKTEQPAQPGPDSLPITREQLISEIAALNTLLGEWGRMQHALIDKATAAQVRLQALYKKVLGP